MVAIEVTTTTKSRRKRWGVHVVRMGRRGMHGILVRKPAEKGPLGRPRRRWVDNIRETGRGGMDWIDLAQNRDQWRAVVNTIMNLRIP
jgi:hypothetical protein